MTRPSALAHADTRERVPAMDPTLASSSPIDRAWRKRKAGNEPTSLGVTPHGVRDPGTKPTETTANGTTRATENAQRCKNAPNAVDLLPGCRQEGDDSRGGPKLLNHAAGGAKGTGGRPGTSG